MHAKNPVVDQYILNSEPFAFPILNHLRELVHFACPDVQETIKWGFPHFEYNGSIICHMASFKQHLAFRFWLGSKLSDPYKILEKTDKVDSMGSIGKIKSIHDLPKDEVLIEYLKEALTLAAQGIKLSKAKASPSAIELTIPEDFATLLNKDLSTKDYFSNFSAAKKREYLLWFAEAKTEATRNKRLAQAIEWISEGKSRYWKYDVGCNPRI